MLFAQASPTPSAGRSARAIGRYAPGNEAAVKTVLVVDDDPAIGQLLLFYLREAGYRAVYVSDGLQALSKAAQLHPSLILLDVMLPGLDGWEVCRELRRASDVPIILLTAKDADRDVVSGLGAGATDYITKPFSGPQLMARIERLMRPASAASFAPAGEAQQRGDHATSALLPEEQRPMRAGTLLRSARRRAGMTLLQAEQHIDIHWEYLQALEMHQLDRIPRQMQQTVLLRYAELFGLDPVPLWAELKKQRDMMVRHTPSLHIRMMQAAGAALLLLTMVLAIYLGTHFLLP